MIISSPKGDPRWAYIAVSDLLEKVRSTEKFQDLLTDLEKLENMIGELVDVAGEAYERQVFIDQNKVVHDFEAPGVVRERIIQVDQDNQMKFTAEFEAFRSGVIERSEFQSIADARTWLKSERDKVLNGKSPEDFFK